ncbi:MAG: hypothetical protein SGI84_10195 [Gemmatimonadota bacterium]|nr:hypothetical protein [Gemmatimonadota bacterium]
MTAGRSAANRAYRLAVPISIASAVLGVGRELVILQRIGLSEANDLLQYYLSITFTISILGDAMRLAVLNLLQVGTLASALASTMITAVGVGVPIAFWYARGGPPLDPGLLVVAGVAGILNLVTVVLLVHRQRSGRFLPAHVITVLPNILIFLGVVLAMGRETPTFVAVVVGLFLAAPVIQIVMLLALRPGNSASPPVPEPGNGVLRGMGQIGLHGLGAVGAQAGHILIRTALAGQATGMLTVFVLLSRAVDTTRAILLDTLIGARLADWAAGRGRVPTLLDPVHLSLPLLGGILALTGAAALLGSGASTALRLVPWLVVVLLPGAWLTFLQRAGYFYLNATASPRALIVRLGVLDAGLAALLASATALANWGPLLLVWLFFVLRIALQIVLIQRAGVVDVRD